MDRAQNHLGFFAPRAALVADACGLVDGRKMRCVCRDREGATAGERKERQRRRKDDFDGISMGESENGARGGSSESKEARSRAGIG